MRVLELGTDTPFVRYPVPAGSHEADVDTAVLGPVSTSSLGGSSRAEERPRWSPSLEAKAGAMPLVNSSSSLSSAAEEMAQSVRRRFFYSTVALVVLIMTVLLGGGTYLIGSINHSASQLLSAHGLIDGANAALTRQDPVSALKQLATAQKVLLGAQGPLLRDQTQYNALQKSLQETFQKAVVAYNRKELITQLPCPAAHEVSLNGNVQALSLSTMRDEKGMTYWYALGTGEKLYRLDEQDHRLKDPRSFSNGARALSLAGNGQHLFALTTLSEPTAYNLSMFSYDGPPNLKEDQVAIESNLIKEGWVPAFVTAYGADVFLILVEKKAAHRTMILAYDANNWQNAPQKLQTDPLPDVVSVAAFPGKRLFFLTSDGRVKLLTFSDGGNATHAEDVLLQNPVSPPLVNEGSNFTLSTPIPTPGPEPSAGETFAQVGVTLLTVGSVGSDNPHLYMVDNPRHRIMDLKFIPGQSVPVAQTPTPGASTPSPSPTASSGAGVINPPSLKLLQQLASTTLLSSVKSATVGADGKELYLLTQGGSALTTVSSIDKAPSC